jgi:hypothetical protein
MEKLDVESARAELERSAVAQAILRVRKALPQSENG